MYKFLLIKKAHIAPLLPLWRQLAHICAGQWDNYGGTDTPDKSDSRYMVKIADKGEGQRQKNIEKQGRAYEYLFFAGFIGEAAEYGQQDETAYTKRG